MPKGFNRNPNSFTKRIAKKEPEDIEPVKPFQLIEGGRHPKRRLRQLIKDMLRKADPGSVSPD